MSAHGICILMHAYTLYHCYMFLVLTSMIVCTETGSETVQKIHRCILGCNCLCVVLIAALYACVAYRRARDDPAAAAGARRRCVSACVSQWRFVKWSDGHTTQCQCKTPQRPIMHSCIVVHICVVRASKIISQCNMYVHMHAWFLVRNDLLIIDSYYF